MASFLKADPEVYDLLNEVIAEHFADINAIGLTFDLMMAFPPVDEQEVPTGPALTKYGVEALAIVSAVPLKYRSRGCGDCEILLSSERWVKLTEDEKQALLHHELTHVTISRKTNSEVIRDALGRPKIKMRPHDIQIGWFADTAKAYGMASQEVQQAQAIVATGRQTYFPFMGSGPVMELPMKSANPTPEKPLTKKQQAAAKKAAEQE